LTDKGWISLHRKLKDSNVFQDEKLLKIWIYCLLEATHEPYQQLVGKQLVELDVGAFVFGRKSVSRELRINESTLWRNMKLLEKMGNISISSNSKFSIIKVVNFSLYQDKENKSEQQMNNKKTHIFNNQNENGSKSEQQTNSYYSVNNFNTENQYSKSEQQMNNKRTTNEQQVNTNNNINNINNINNKDIVVSKYPIEEVISYLNTQASKSYKSSTKKNQDVIKARFNEGFTLEDFKKVIDNKVASWKNDTKMDQYLRPQTLFGTKFESYLNEKQVSKNNKTNNNNLANSDNRMTEEERRQYAYQKLYKPIPL